MYGSTSPDSMRDVVMLPGLNTGNLGCGGGGGGGVSARGAKLISATSGLPYPIDTILVRIVGKYELGWPFAAGAKLISPASELP
jgi:hypothetical protein